MIEAIQELLKKEAEAVLNIPVNGNLIRFIERNVS